MSIRSKAKQKVADAKSGFKAQMGGVSSLTPLALAVVSLAIVVGVGVIVLAEMDDAVTNANASDVLSTAITAMQTFADFFTVEVMIWP